MADSPGPVLKVHQVVFRQHKNKATVSCVCRASETGEHVRDKGGGEFCWPMTMSSDDKTLWDTYNRPENHWVAFTQKDRVNT